MESTIKKLKVLAVADDPGGANLVATVIKALAAQFDFTLILPLQRRNKFATNILPSQQLYYLAAPQLTAWLESQKQDYDLLFMGTSVGYSLEKQLLDKLSAKKIPSIAILDSWGSYGMRFRQDMQQSQLTHLPDKILVMNDVAKAALITEGIPSGVIEVVGHPVYEAITPAKYDAHALPEFVFTSQPLAEYFADSLGYNQWSALSDIAEVLRTFEPQPSFVVRLNPNDNSQQYQDILHALGVHFTLQPPSATSSSMHALQCWLGFYSPILIEACFAGCTAYAYQPGMGVTQPYQQLGVLLRHPQELHEAMTTFWRRHQCQPYPPLEMRRQEYYQRLGMPLGSIERVAVQLQAVGCKLNATLGR